MVGGGGRAGDREAAEKWSRADAAGFGALIERLVDASVEYLSGQVAAGADVLQIFDTWAGRLSGEAFQRWVVEPTRAIVTGVKRRHPEVPIVGFPMGAGAAIPVYVAQCGVDGVSCDATVPLDFIARELSGRVVVQGNLEPELLVAGGPEMERQAERILAALSGKPFIFNLGHGVLPQTPAQNVVRLLRLIREGK
jgi:uroporphyrinogen decarboxylase